MLSFDVIRNRHEGWVTLSVSAVGRRERYSIPDQIRDDYSVFGAVEGGARADIVRELIVDCVE